MLIAAAVSVYLMAGGFVSKNLFPDGCVRLCLDSLLCTVSLCYAHRNKLTSVCGRL